MKRNHLIALLVTASFSALGSAEAQIISNVGVITGQTTMPGSVFDYSFYGNPADFPNDSYYVPGSGGGGSQPSVLFDFTESGGDFQYINGGQPGNFSVINSPDGTPVQTGILFGGGGGASIQDAATYTINDSGIGFNIADFNIYVMYGTATNGGYTDSTISLSLVTPLGLVTQTQAVVDPHTGIGADFAEFNVLGAVAGEKLEVGYTGAGSVYGELGGVSFESAVPEPSTYVMILGAMGMLVLVSRSRGKLTA